MNSDSRLDAPTAGAAFAANVRTLLAEDARRYRLFGIYWFFVKALLKRYYDANEMPILGDFTDPSVNERIPASARASGQAMLAAAAAEYQQNASFNLGRNSVEDDDGETFLLIDPDVEG